MPDRWRLYPHMHKHTQWIEPPATVKSDFIPIRHRPGEARDVTHTIVHVQLCGRVLVVTGAGTGAVSVIGRVRAAFRR